MMKLVIIIIIIMMMKIKIKIMIMSIKSAQLKIYKAKIFIKNKLGAFDARHHQGELKKSDNSNKA